MCFIFQRRSIIFRVYSHSFFGGSIRNPYGAPFFSYKRVAAFPALLSSVSLVVVGLQHPGLVGAPLRALVPVRADLWVPLRLHPLPAHALEAEPAGGVLGFLWEKQYRVEFSPMKIQ